MGQTYSITIVLKNGGEVRFTHYAYSIDRAFLVARSQHPNWAALSVSIKREDML